MKYQKGQSLSKLTKNLETIEPQISIIDQIYITDDNVLKFITTLEKNASANGVTQKINLNPAKTKEIDGYMKNPLQINTSGSFKNQLNYLLSLEAINYYVNINTLELNLGSRRAISEDGQISDGRINMQIFADTFWK